MLGRLPALPRVVASCNAATPRQLLAVVDANVAAYRLSLVPRLFATTLPPDLVCINVAPMQDGALSLGIEVNILPAAIEACRTRGGLVIAQVNSEMPWTYGDGLLDPELVDFAIEADEPLDEHAATVPDDAARRIGELVAGRIADGATLQLGIGMVPDATLPGPAYNSCGPRRPTRPPASAPTAP